MKKRMLRTLAVLFALLLLPACGEKEELPGLTDAEAQAVLAELLPKSAPLMQLFFGEGLPYVEPEEVLEYDGAQYEPVKEGAAYTSIAQMKAAMEGVYSADYQKTLYIMMFEGYEKPKETEKDVEYLDERILPRYLEEDGVLKIDIKYEPYAITVTPQAEGARVVRGNATRVIVEVPTVDKKGQSGTMRVNLALDGGVWLLDGATY